MAILISFLLLGLNMISVISNKPTTFSEREKPEYVIIAAAKVGGIPREQ
jgi:hypothetical protein